MKPNENTAGENWTKNDLHVYILLYCANIDTTIDEDELEFINEKTYHPKYKAIKKEFDKDNDYQGTQKIEAAIKRLGYTETQIDNLLAEIKELFWEDGSFDAMENALLNYFKRVLKP